MYVCICHALNEGRVREMLASGCETVSDIYRACGMRPQCGKCICAIADMVRSRRGDSESAPHAAD